MVEVLQYNNDAITNMFNCIIPCQLTADIVSCQNDNRHVSWLGPPTMSACVYRGSFEL